MNNRSFMGHVCYASDELIQHLKLHHTHIPNEQLRHSINTWPASQQHRGPFEWDQGGELGT